MIDNGKLTMLEIEDLARLAKEFNVEFHVTIYPDSAEVELMPWCPTMMESTNTTKPVEEPKVIVTNDRIRKAVAERIRQEVPIACKAELMKE